MELHLQLVSLGRDLDWVQVLDQVEKASVEVAWDGS